MLTKKPDYCHSSEPSSGDSHTETAKCGAPQLINTGALATQTLGVEEVDKQKDLPKILPYVRKRPSKRSSAGVHVQQQ